MMASHAAVRDRRVAHQAGLVAAAVDPQASSLVGVETGYAPAAAEVAPPLPFVAGPVTMPRAVHAEVRANRGLVVEFDEKMLAARCAFGQVTQHCDRRVERAGPVADRLRKGDQCGVVCAGAIPAAQQLLRRLRVFGAIAASSRADTGRAGIAVRKSCRSATRYRARTGGSIEQRYPGSRQG